MYLLNNIKLGGGIHWSICKKEPDATVISSSCSISNHCGEWRNNPESGWVLVRGSEGTIPGTNTNVVNEARKSNLMNQQ